MQFQKIKIFYDGTNLEKYCNCPFVQGVTTNTSFMKQAGEINYLEFYEKNSSYIRDMPISFQIYQEDEDKAFRDALKIASYGRNTYVKVPVVDTNGCFNSSLMKRMLGANLKVNITSVYTTEQIDDIKEIVKGYKCPIIVSIFSGRISDTARDPVIYVQHAVQTFKDHPNVEILWAGCKEVLSIRHAENSGCHIITVPDAILDRIHRVDKDLRELSVETVKSFKNDGVTANIVI